MPQHLGLAFGDAASMERHEASLGTTSLFPSPCHSKLTAGNPGCCFDINMIQEDCYRLFFTVIQLEYKHVAQMATMW